MRSEIGAIVDVLDMLGCRNFHLRLMRIEGGFRRPEMTGPAEEAADDSEGGLCTLLFTDNGAPPAEIRRVTAYISDGLLPAAKVRPSLPPQQGNLARRFRFAISPLWQLGHEWRRTQQKIAERDRRGRPAPLPPPEEAARQAAQRDTTKPPTVLIGMHFLEVGGAESFAMDVALAAADRYRVIVVTDRPSLHDQRRRLEAHGDIRVYHIDRHVPTGCEHDFIAALIAKENVFAIHINHCMSLYTALPRIRSTFSGIAVIDTTHILENADGGYCTTSGFYTRHIDRHHFYGRQVHAYLVEGFGAGDRTTLGYLTHRATAPPATPNLDTREAGSPVRIGFIGRMTQQKRPMLFIAAAAEIRRALRQRGFDSQFVMMGDESLLPALSSLARRLRVADVLEFRPPGYGAEKLLTGCHILLMTSDVEGIALVALEAASAGAITISTDVGAQREIVPDGLLLPPRPGDFVTEASGVTLKLVADATFRSGAWAETLRLHQALRSGPKGLDEVLKFFEDAADAPTRAVRSRPQF